jgi:hypothetical protein
MKRKLPGPTKKAGKGSAAEEKAYQALKPLIRKMQVLEAQSVAMGGAPDRELLTCPKCGLREDVLIGTQLFTTREPIGGIADNGLRFEKLRDGWYLCPSCSTRVAEPEPPPMPPLFPTARRKRRK